VLVVKGTTNLANIRDLIGPLPKELADQSLRAGIVRGPGDVVPDIPLGSLAK